MKLVYILITIVTILLGTIPIYVNRRKISNILFSLLIFSITGWIASNLLIFQTDLYVLWNRFAYFFALLSIYFFFLFSITYPKNRYHITVTKLVISSIPCVISSSLIPTQWHIATMENYSEIKFGIAHNLFILVFLSYFLLGIYFGILHIKNCTEIEKKKLKNINIGFILFLIIAIATNLVIPTIYNITTSYKYGPIASLVYICFTTYAILKSELLNKLFVINRLVANILSISSYIIGFTTLKWLFDQLSLTSSTTLNMGLISLYLSVCCIFHEKYRVFLQSTTEKLFLKTGYDYKAALLELSEESKAIYSLRSLRKTINSFFLNSLEISPSNPYFPEGFETQKNLSQALVFESHYLDPTTVASLLEKDLTVVSIASLSSPHPDIASFSYALILKSMDDQLYGILFIGKKLNESRFTLEDEQLFSTVANQLTLCLERIKQTRATSQIKVIQDIQKELIPTKITLPNCQVTSYFEPSEEIGGDYYDSFQKGNDFWLIVGDVSGHGTISGFVMFMINSIISSIIHSFDHFSPGILNKKANYILCKNFEDIKDPRPMTIATLKTHDGRTFDCHGCHENIYHYQRKEDRVITCPLTSIPLGIGLSSSLDDSLFSEKTIKIEDDDLLIICTDGIIESCKEKGEEFGEARLKGVILENKNKSIYDIKEAIIKATLCHSGNVLVDDLSLIIIQSTPPPPSNP